MSISRTLQTIKDDSQDSWRPGQNLARLRVERIRLAKLQVALGERVLCGPFDEQAGAALMVLGARVFHGVADGVYTYDAIGEFIGVPDLSGRIGNVERDAMERGLGRVFGVGVAKSSGTRRFITTMLLHSGGGWGILHELCGPVLRAWSWQSVLAATEDVAAEFILTAGAALGGRTRQLTSSEEARLAAVEMLRSVARACLQIEEEGWLAPSWEGTLAAMRADGQAPSSLLPMLADDAAAGVLQKALALGAEVADERRFDWRWENRTDRGLLPRLVLRAPRVLTVASLPGLPAAVERLRLFLAGAEEQKDRLVYVRSGDEFRLTSGGDRLPFSRTAGDGVPVLAEYRTASGLGEMVLLTCAFPWAPIATFDVESGRLVRASPAGRRVALVRLATTKILVRPRGFEERSAVPADLVCLLGTSPAEPVAIGGTVDGGAFEHWIGPRGAGPGIELPPSPWPECRHEGARCYRDWPAPRIDAPSPEVTIIGPGGRVPAMLRGGRLRPAAPTPAGSYRIESRVGEHLASAHFTLLPGAVFETESAVDRTVLRARAGSTPGKLLLVGGVGVGLGELTLGPEISGPTPVTVLLTIDGRSLQVSWRAPATPRRADVVPHPDDQPTADRDLSLLRGQGGLRIRGPGRMPFTIQAKYASWSWCLTAEGERFFPFSVLSARELRDDHSVAIKVRWQDGVVQSMGRFHDPTARRAQVELVDEKLRIEVGKLLPGDPVVELVRAWEPWAPPLRLAGTLVPAEGGKAPRVEVSLPGPAAPHQVVVMVGDQRLSGMALIHRDAPVDPALDPLGASLWQGQPDRGRLVERLDGPDGAEVLRGLLRCYRRYGPQWFMTSERVADAISWRGIQALVDSGGDEEERDLTTALLGALQRPVELAIRHADFKRVSPPTSGETWVRAMRVFAEVQTGLLLPAWHAWGLVHPDFMWEIAPLLLQMQEAERWLLPLSPEERDLLREPPEVVGPAIRPRVRGLIEIRVQLVQLRERSDAGMLSDADERVQSWLREAIAAKVPRALLLGGVPQEVAEVEAAVVRVAGLLNDWRRARASDFIDVSWPDLRIFWERFPSALDFWLSRLFIHPQPLEPTPSMRVSTPHPPDRQKK